MNLAKFEVSAACIGCGNCTKVCPGGILFMGDDRKPHIKEFDSFGWDGCWRCEHCLSVCPVGAIQILEHRPQDSLCPVSTEQASRTFDSLIANRHSCRRYQHRNVPPEIIQDMLERLANAPNGGNKQQVEYTLIDDMEQMDFFRTTVTAKMDELARQEIYPVGFGKKLYEDMKRWEDSVRPDMVFCGAPHLLIPHAPLGHGEPVQDVIIAGTYFELLCASRGLGAVMMTFPIGVLKTMPEIKAMLKIPDDHCVPMLIGFGYPEIQYARGSQRTTLPSKIHRLHFDDEKSKLDK